MKVHLTYHVSIVFEQIHLLCVLEVHYLQWLLDCICNVWTEISLHFLGNL
jgi:hypothetical protein